VDVVEAVFEHVSTVNEAEMTATIEHGGAISKPRSG
jgi:hypothetical protein